MLSLLDALARSFYPGDGLFATSGPARDVPEGVVARVEIECPQITYAVDSASNSASARLSNGS